MNDNIVRLSEEASEVIQICCKIQRFGLMSYHPEDKNKQINRSLLEQEIGDLLANLQILSESKVISISHINYFKNKKYEELKNE